jgi:hypothetical protein
MTKPPDGATMLSDRTEVGKRRALKRANVAVARKLTVIQ